MQPRAGPNAAPGNAQSYSAISHPAFERVRRHLDSDALVALARELVAQPSHTIEGEIEAAHVLARALASHGIAAQEQPVGDFGVNLLAELPGTEREPGLLFNGHLDVVPPSAAMRYPPFEGRIENGSLWGRGSADMKAGLAAMARAMVAIKETGVELRRPLTLAAVANEEKGNRGTAALIRSASSASDGLRAAFAVVGEPTSLDIVLAHKGVDRYRVTVQGLSAHESVPERGENAIVAAARLILALQDGLFPRMRAQTHPVLGQATYNIGTIEGGTSRNMVPDRCSFQIAKRWLPGDSPASIRREIEEVVQAVGGMVIVGHEPEFDEIPHPPLDTPPGDPLVAVLSTVVGRVRGHAPALTGMPAFTDAALLASAGIRSVVFGPGEIRLAHTDDEHVPLVEVIAAAEAYAALALALCAT